MPARDPESYPETKQRLLMAALHAFGHRDYDGVSIREIVKEAGANISAISYHFGGKQELYHATVAFLVEQLHADIINNIQQVEGRVADATAEQCATMLCQLLGNFLEQVLLGEIGQHAPGIIFREQNEPTAAFEILYENLLEPMHKILAALVAGYRGGHSTDPEVIIMAHALLGQFMIFRIGRTTLLRRLNQPVYSPSLIKQLKVQLASLVLSVLNSTSDDITVQEATHHA